MTAHTDHEPARPGAAPSARDEQRLARAALTVLTEPADPVMGTLLRAADPVSILGWIRAGDVPPTIAARSGLLPALARRMAARWAAQLPRIPSAADLTRYEQAGIRLLCPDDYGWPGALDDLGDARPYALWLRGNGDLRTGLDGAIAIAGSRAATGYGTHVATEIAADLAEAGHIVVSGAAYGIDAAAHRGTLAAGGTTIAVLAGGADQPYPAGHRELLDAITTRGLVISEYPPGSQPTRLRFLTRNRIIAALTRATVIVEAGPRSGSLNTASHAAMLGRLLMAVPGPVTSLQSAGCHHIITSLGGTLVTSAADIRTILGSPPLRPRPQMADGRWQMADGIRTTRPAQATRPPVVETLRDWRHQP